MLGKPLVILGMMGSGKTSVSKVLSKKYGLNLYEMDSMIEEQQGIAIPQIFERHGEEYFRKLESGLLLDILDKKDVCVISTGGGVVKVAENLAMIKEKAVSVWLKVDVSVLLEHVGSGKGRPLLLQGDDPAETLEILLNTREALYSKADIHIDNNHNGHIHVLADQIMDAVFSLD